MSNPALTSIDIPKTHIKDAFDTLNDDFKLLLPVSATRSYNSISDIVSHTFKTVTHELFTVNGISNSNNIYIYSVGSNNPQLISTMSTKPNMFKLGFSGGNVAFSVIANVAKLYYRRIDVVSDVVEEIAVSSTIMTIDMPSGATSAEFELWSDEETSELEALVIHSTNVTKVDIVELTHLKHFELVANNTNIEYIDFSQNNQLNYVNVSNTSLVSIDITKSPNLRELICNDCQLSSLQIPSSVKYLNCRNNSISSITLPSSGIVLDVGQNEILTINLKADELYRLLADNNLMRNFYIMAENLSVFSIANCQWTYDLYTYINHKLHVTQSNIDYVDYSGNPCTSIQPYLRHLGSSVPNPDGTTINFNGINFIYSATDIDIAKNVVKSQNLTLIPLSADFPSFWEDDPTGVTTPFTYGYVVNSTSVNTRDIDELYNTNVPLNLSVFCKYGTPITKVEIEVTFKMAFNGRSAYSSIDHGIHKYKTTLQPLTSQTTLQVPVQVEYLPPVSDKAKLKSFVTDILRVRIKYTMTDTNTTWRRFPAI